MRLEPLYRLRFTYPEGWDVTLEGGWQQHLFLAEGDCQAEITGRFRGVNFPLRRTPNGPFQPDFRAVIETDDAATIMVEWHGYPNATYPPPKDGKTKDLPSLLPRTTNETKIAANRDKAKCSKTDPLLTTRSTSATSTPSPRPSRALPITRASTGRSGRYRSRTTSEPASTCWTAKSGVALTAAKSGVALTAAKVGRTPLTWRHRRSPLTRGMRG